MKLLRNFKLFRSFSILINTDVLAGVGNMINAADVAMTPKLRLA